MKLNLIEPKEILDFEKETGIELVVTEFPKKTNSYRYSVWFADSWIKSPHGLVSSEAYGDTIDEALINYCDKINLGDLVFNATGKRKKIKIQYLTHTKLLNK